MVEFTCPSILGKYSAFNKRFEKAILKGRSVGCSKEAMEEGQMRAEEVGPRLDDHPKLIWE